MKTVFKSVIAIVIFSLVFTSCKKDGDIETFAKPVISEFEVEHHEEGGHDHDDHDHGDHDHDEEGPVESHAGGELHVEAKIVAEAKIAYIVVEIHNEETGALVEEVFMKKYVDNKGDKNATFHKHVVIPADAVEGEKYELHLKVVDESGQTTQVGHALHVEKE